MTIYTFSQLTQTDPTIIHKSKKATTIIFPLPAEMDMIQIIRGKKE